MSEDLVVIQPVDLEGIVEGAEPKLVAELIRHEQSMISSAITFMDSLRYIADHRLFEARGFDNIRDYVKQYLYNRMPYSVGFANSLLNLSYKVENSEELKRLDSEKIKEFVKLSKNPDVIQIYAEGKVMLSDGTVIPTEEYKSLIKRDLLKEMDSEIKDSKKALKEQIEIINRERDRVINELSETKKAVDKLKSDKEVTAKLVGVHGDKLSIIVSLANAREFLNGDCTTTTSNLYKTINDVNLIGIDLRKEEDIVESVEMLFDGLKIAMKRLHNSWSPYCKFDFDFSDIDGESKEIATVDGDTSVGDPVEETADDESDYKDGSDKYNRTVAIDLLSKLSESLNKHARGLVSQDDVASVFDRINEFQEGSDFLSEDVLELIIEHTFDADTPEKLDAIIENLKHEV